MAEDLQVLIKLVTKLPHDFKVPEAPVAVPVTLKRLGLSQIVNQLLNLEPKRPFDFIIQPAGQLLRQSLQQHLLENELSAESTLEVEYIPAVVPPKQEQSAPHDDWVSCVDSQGRSCIVSGSYDGNLRLWDGDMQCKATVHAHADGVNAAAFVQGSQEAGLLVTAGKDHRVCMWQADVGAQGPWACRLVATCSGHTDAVEGLSVSPSGDRLASCGWDGALLLWRTGSTVLESAAEAAAGSTPASTQKKRKVSQSTEGAAAAAAAAASSLASVAESPLSRLEGHLHCVSSAAWPVQSSLYSGGWDHSVRRWDVATGINTDTYNGSKVVSSVAASSSSPDVVAFGGSDKALRIWDSRSRKGEGLAVQACSSHGNWISCVRWSPSSAHHIATASLDSTVKLWDMRSVVPLATLSTHKDKVLCVGWVQRSGAAPRVSAGLGDLVSGGADCSLQLYAEVAFSSC